MDNLTSTSNLIWLDLEMTGLNPDHDRILEIATVVTNAQLQIIAAGPVLAIHQSEEMLAGMDDWCQKQHNKSGLVDRVRDSTINEDQAAAETLLFLQQYVQKGSSPMCGNSICQDRRFLFRYMPSLEQFFHYRNLDVSTLKILAQLWYPTVLSGFEKNNAHLALADIEESIAELRYYRSKVFLEHAK